MNHLSLNVNTSSLVLCDYQTFETAAWFDYPAKKMTMIGLTGTKGKTTTAFMTKKILEEAERVMMGSKVELLNQKDFALSRMKG